jgi:hypothetical protein
MIENGTKNSYFLSSNNYSNKPRMLLYAPAITVPIVLSLEIGTVLVIFFFSYPLFR